MDEDFCCIHLLMKKKKIERLLCAQQGVRYLTTTKIKPYALGHKVLTIICREERLEQMLRIMAAMVACKSPSDPSRRSPLKFRLGTGAWGGWDVI